MLYFHCVLATDLLYLHYLSEKYNLAKDFIQKQCRALKPNNKLRWFQTMHY